ncbi:MAG: uroporphyrinogen-III synthase [Pseudomonadota bacterium]
MRLLVTRPQPEAAKSAAALEDLGHDVLVDPVLEVSYSSQSIDFPLETSIAVTSGNGVRALTKLTTTAQERRIPVYAVGDKTADLAKEAGFETVESASGTVDDLVRLLGEVQPAAIVYVCGRDRKGRLEDKLAERGIRVTVAERYQADKSKGLRSETVEALSKGTIDGILLYSQRSAEIFLEHLKSENISHSTKLVRHFCLAPSIATLLSASDKDEVFVAARPEEHALFELLDDVK